MAALVATFALIVEIAIIAFLHLASAVGELVLVRLLHSIDLHGFHHPS